MSYRVKDLQKKYVEFHVTGVEYMTNRRFKFVYDNSARGVITAFGINLWRGSVWGVREDGSRKKLKSVFN